MHIHTSSWCQLSCTPSVVVSLPSAGYRRQYRRLLQCIVVIQKNYRALYWRRRFQLTRWATITLQKRLKRAKGTTALHSTSRGEEEEGRRRREETTRRARGTGEVSSSIAFIIISTFMFLWFVSKFLVMFFCFFIRERQRMELELLAQAVSEISVFLSVCLPVYLSVCLSFCMSVYLCLSKSVCLSVHLSICLSISVCLSVYLSHLSVYICLSVFLFTYPSVRLSVYLSIYLSVCLSISVCLSVYLSVEKFFYFF